MREAILEGLAQAGWVIYPLVLSSVIGWYLAFRRLLGLAALDWGGHRRFRKRLAEGGWEAFIARLGRRERRTAAGQALVAVYGARARGRAAMEARLDETMKFLVPDLERHLSTLAILASAAPLVGLLGTVAGIIGTFKVISAFGTGNTALMSDSIAESLMATQNGLLVAFPLMLMHVYLASRAEAVEKRTLAAGRALINRCVEEDGGGRPPGGEADPEPGSPRPLAEVAA